eukprot:TRINITY_DN539_c0_g1_i7.p2 TRINITY_DN539_c0_g1~~TRINITY_DN539_c0_g1_i7.p2  ORF type:complete len:199 (-),score=46.08 TRINITY_DN539_c0_g1_i7:94-690(-)
MWQSWSKFPAKGNRRFCEIWIISDRILPSPGSETGSDSKENIFWSSYLLRNLNRKIVRLKRSIHQILVYEETAVETTVQNFEYTSGVTSEATSLETLETTLETTVENLATVATAVDNDILCLQSMKSTRRGQETTMFLTYHERKGEINLDLEDYRKNHWFGEGDMIKFLEQERDSKKKRYEAYIKGLEQFGFEFSSED